MTPGDTKQAGVYIVCGGCMYSMRERELTLAEGGDDLGRVLLDGVEGISVVGTTAEQRGERRERIYISEFQTTAPNSNTRRKTAAAALTVGPSTCPRRSRTANQTYCMLRLANWLFLPFR